jgi:hypothetical protein
MSLWLLFANDIFAYNENLQPLVEFLSRVDCSNGGSIYDHIGLIEFFWLVLYSICISITVLLQVFIQGSCIHFS